ncbi:unnamed protein product [Hermetia illucens]|uniref:Uncharacterized protein n=1 Tax=Hermetia illucens TaxID=343691 RepID=A0A7R8ULU3_HERIL|nr:unnamed protein product [Hermetia illucens]
MDSVDTKQNTKESPLPILANYVVNKSSIEFTPRELTVLNNGLGYALSATTRLDETIVNIEAGIKWLSSEAKEEIRSGISKISLKTEEKKLNEHQEDKSQYIT